MSRHHNIVFTRDKKVKKFRYDTTAATYSYITNERLIVNRKISDISESYIIRIVQSSIFNTTSDCSDLGFIHQTWFNRINIGHTVTYMSIVSTIIFDVTGNGYLNNPVEHIIIIDNNIVIPHSYTIAIFMRIL